MQLEALECGAASLCMLLAYYGKWVPLEQVRADCGVSRDGSNAKNLLKAARSYGMKAQGARAEPKVLREKGTFPCIIHWEFNHFVVLDGFKGDKVYLNDPAKGAYSVSMELFDEGFTGIVLLIEPGENFEPGGKPKSVLEFARKRLTGAKTTMLFVALTTLISTLAGIVSSGFSRAFFDYLLPGNNPEWVTPFFIGLGVLTFIQLASAWIQAVYSLRMNGKLAAVGSTTFMWKILKLPMEFFSQRMAGDIQGRKASNASIAGKIVNTLAPMVLQTASMVFYLVVMIRYSWLLTLVGLVSVAVNLWLSREISKKRVNITRVAMRDKGKLSGATVSGIDMIETIKSSGAENGYYERWAGYQASVNTQNVRYAKLNQYLGMVPGAVSSVLNIIILVLGVWLAMKGEFTVGMIMAFQGFLASFMGPFRQLIGAGQSIQEMRTDMERVEDVMEYPDAAVFGQKEEAQEYDKLSGCLSMKHVTFGYSRLADPLIEDFSLELQTGQQVAFVGISGCGKSTLAKLISGLYQPWKGEITFDGRAITEIDRSIFTGSVAVVDQYKLSDGGNDFSGGQRQRLEIARVLAQDPTIIIMDEATSALDARTEYNVVQSIRNRGISCVVLAHRLSTIRDCDEIIVLDKGKVVERGTHDQLMALEGKYKELVSNE